jgi:hypothetical protein
MTKAILMAAGGCVLVIGSLAFLHIAEVRQWLPALLIVGGALAFFGFKRYRDA